MPGNFIRLFPLFCQICWLEEFVRQVFSQGVACLGASSLDADGRHCAGASDALRQLQTRKFGKEERQGTDECISGSLQGKLSPQLDARWAMEDVK